jgi:hypothetical protein
VLRRISLFQFTSPFACCFDVFLKDGEHCNDWKNKYLPGFSVSHVVILVSFHYIHPLLHTHTNTHTHTHTHTFILTHTLLTWKQNSRILNTNHYWEKVQCIYLLKGEKERSKHGRFK